MITRWTVRTWRGHPLGIVETADIDYALAHARRKYRIHDLTVDNLPPIGGAKSKARIRYLDPAECHPLAGK